MSLALSVAGVALPAGVVLGYDAVVYDCDHDTEIRAHLDAIESSGGGTLTFECYGSTVIPLTATLPTITKPVVIDGGGTVTIDGQGGVRPFVVAAAGHLTLRGVTIKRGYAGVGGGGAIHNSGRVTLRGMEISDSYAAGGGGAIGTTGAVDITASTFARNRSTDGGAIHARSANAVLTVTNSVFQGNAVSKSGSDASYGGAFYADAGAAVTIHSSDFRANRAGHAGGALAVIGAATAVSLAHTSVRENSLRHFGAGIFVHDGRLDVHRSTITSNKGNFGSGIAAYGGATSTVTESTIASNGLGTSGTGSGVLNVASTMTLLRSTLKGNASHAGGAIGNQDAGTITVTESTLSGNRAVRGGAIENAGTARLTNVTLAGTTADASSGAIHNAAGAGTHLELRNVVVAGTVSGRNCAFIKAPDVRLTSASSDASCGFGSGRDSIDVMLKPLANTGIGWTDTHEPHALSPLIDAGTTTGQAAQDQRGVWRPQYARVDIGSVERTGHVENDDPAWVGYDTWRPVRLASAYESAYNVSATAGAVTRFGFEGHAISWVTRKSASGGVAEVTIDGVMKCRCDLYSATTVARHLYTFSRLPATGRAHQIEIRVTGARNASSAGSDVASDGFAAAPGYTIDDTAYPIRYGSWSGAYHARALGTSYHVSSTAGAVARFRFSGTAIRFHTAKGPSYGKVDVLIDGVVKSNDLDLYAATPQWRVGYSYAGLSRDTHTIEIRPTRTRNVSAQGFGVVVDGFSGLIDPVSLP